ncbi:MAG: hypothetical protein EOM32_02150 [Spirochaetia bacterium]|nr:hypothetical protein [Spirochaetia bacterium]NCC88920.1 hypothetical protein [Spirochaetia bacterium]
MKTLVGQWQEGKSATQLQEQQILQAELETLLPREEAALVSLHRQGAVFRLVEQAMQAYTAKKLLILLAIQIVVSQLPSLFGFPPSDANLPYYALYLSFLVFPPLAVLLASDQRAYLYRFVLALALLALSLTFTVTLRINPTSQSFALSALHLPLLCLLLLSTVKQKTNWPEHMAKHLQNLCEAALLTFLLFCSVMVLMMLSLFLFEAIGMDVESFVSSFVLTAVFPALPLLAFYLLGTRNLGMGTLLRLLAKLFLPLFTLMMAAFLIALFAGKGSFTEDRSLLLGIDLLLALVLLMILLAANLWEQEQLSSWYKPLIITASLLALAIDLAALLAITQRFLNYGITPNRLAVLSENLLLGANLGALALTMLRGKSMARMQSIFFALYGSWFLVVVVLFPLMFGSV